MSFNLGSFEITLLAVCGCIFLIAAILHSLRGIRFELPNTVAVAILATIGGAVVAVLATHQFAMSWYDFDSMLLQIAANSGQRSAPPSMERQIPATLVPPASDDAATSDLLVLVGKIDLLTSGPRLVLHPEQASDLAGRLAMLTQSPAFNEQQAMAHIAGIRSVLSAEQRAVLDALELPATKAPAMAEVPSAPAPAEGREIVFASRIIPRPNPFRATNVNLQLGSLRTRLEQSALPPMH